MQTIKTKTTCGKIIHWFNNDNRRVLHNWDSPAVTYKDKSSKDEYHIFGQQMTREEWLEIMRKEDLFLVKFFVFLNRRE